MIKLKTLYVIRNSYNNYEVIKVCDTLEEAEELRRDYGKEVQYITALAKEVSDRLSLYLQTFPTMKDKYNYQSYIENIENVYIESKCVSVECPRYNICKRSSLHTESGHYYECRDIMNEGSTTCNSNGDISEFWECGPRGNFKLFEKV